LDDTFLPCSFHPFSFFPFYSKKGEAFSFTYKTQVFSTMIFVRRRGENPFESLEANSVVPPDWGRSEDCCSWSRVTCNISTRVSGLDLEFMYQLKNGTSTPLLGDPYWNLNLTIFSSFHELQLLDLEGNSASLQSFDGTYLPAHACAVLLVFQYFVPKHFTIHN
jgi:hypothetical protein